MLVKLNYYLKQKAVGNIKKYFVPSLVCPGLCSVAQSCPTLCDPMDCSPPGSSVHGNSPDKNTGVGCHVLLQGIFPTQESKPGLLHCRRILYQLSYQGSPKSLSRVRLFVTPWMVTLQAPLSRGFSRQEYWSGLPFPPPLSRCAEDTARYLAAREVGLCVAFRMHCHPNGLRKRWL